MMPKPPRRRWSAFAVWHRWVTGMSIQSITRHAFHRDPVRLWWLTTEEGQAAMQNIEASLQRSARRVQRGDDA